MGTKFLKTCIIVALIISCQKSEKQNPFEITNNRIGHLTNETSVQQLDSIFANDSIVKRGIENKSLLSSNLIEIYEKGGAKLLVLEPNAQSDPKAIIESIQIIDPRYKTNKGLSTASVFKDVKEQYAISKINNTLSAAVIFVDSIQAYFTIDKKELPKEFQFNTDRKIESSDIPNSSKIKHFWIHWDKN